MSEGESDKVTDEEIQEYLRRQEEHPSTEESVNSIVESMSQYKTTDPEEIKKNAARAGMTPREYGKHIIHEALKELRRTRRDSEIDYEIMRRKLQEMPAAAKYPPFMNTMANLKQMIDADKRLEREWEEELRKT
jgi:Glu-tRNA(Gln) amidotransferase subunit E-like FAD-binding protein